MGKIWSLGQVNPRGIVGAVYEGVNELEEREEQLPSWNRRGGPKGRGGSKVEQVVFDSNERMGRRVIRSIYHPGAARHPSCSRRGAVPPSPPGLGPTAPAYNRHQSSDPDKYLDTAMSPPYFIRRKTPLLKREWKRNRSSWWNFQSRHDAAMAPVP